MNIFKTRPMPSLWYFLRMDDRLFLIFMGIIVGICSGLAALALSVSLTTLLETTRHYRHFWWSFVLPGFGAALSSLFLNKVLNEGAGHGVPEVIYSVSRYGGLIRFRSSYSRLISSCLTIGSGGSAGPEAPVVMSGAAIGSNIAKFFSLNDRQRITLVGCGAAGAISSIFNAPIAGMVFTIEVILGEWSSLNIVPIAVASVSGAQVFRLLEGNHIVFGHAEFDIGTLDIFAAMGLALVTAGVSILLTRSMRKMHHFAAKVPVDLWMRAFLGGCTVGIIGIFYPVVLGEGYHSIQDMMDGVFMPGLAVAGMAVLTKILATTFTLGWGGSGGIFAPSLVIGSLTGLTYHRFLTLVWPTVPWISEGCFALLGMAGVIGGMLQAPLTGIFLIVEITGGYDVILPLIIVSALSSTFCYYIEPASFYLKDLVEKGQLLRPGTDARVLSDLSVEELLEKDCIPVTPDTLLRDFIEIIRKSSRNYFPVEDRQTGRFMGMVHFDDVRPYLFNTEIYDTVFLEQIMNTDVEIVHVNDDVSEILRRMDKKRYFSMPVVVNHQFLGMISKATLLDQYRKELRVQTSR